MRRKITLVGIFLLISLFFFPTNQPVQASTNSSYHCLIDGISEKIASLDCTPGFATNHDKVIVFGKLPAEWSKPIGEIDILPDITEGGIVFDANADGTANIIILFTKDKSGKLTAAIYDDEDGDGKVSYIVASNGLIDIIESGPFLKIISPDGWWYKDGKTNFNLDIQVDGKIRAAFGYDFSTWKYFTKNPVVNIHVRDPNNNGRPDYEWRQIFLPFPETSSYRRTEVCVNTEDDEIPISDALLWPYIGSAILAKNTYDKTDYRTSPAPIGIDWTISKVISVREFVASRANAGNYFIYSPNRLMENQISVADFEAPFAFYNISGKYTTLPNLIIRMVYGYSNDFYISESMTNRPVEEVDYTWRYPLSETEQLPIWDYKLSLAGNYEQTSIVTIGDLIIKMTDFENLPYWVTQKIWGLSTFIADEGARNADTEGIIPWSTLESFYPETSKYINGKIDSIPLGSFLDIDQGYRGELATDLKKPPKVYISPIDGKLHLSGAILGVWRIDEDTKILLHDLDGDSYIDQWQNYNNENLSSQIMFSNGYLIYSDENQVLLRNVGALLPSYEEAPPRNEEEWITQGKALEAGKNDFRPQDLLALMSGFKGPFLKIENATIWDFRSNNDTFRFVLKLHPGFDLQGSDFLNLDQTTPSQYLITYKGDFSVTELTPARLTLSLKAPIVELGKPAMLEINGLNTGAADGSNLKLLVRALSGNDIVEIREQDWPALSQVPDQATFSWQPTKAGRWDLQAWVQDASGEHLTEASIAVQVPDTKHSSILLLSSEGGRRLLAFGALLAFTGIISMVGVIGLWKENSNDK